MDSTIKKKPVGNDWGLEEYISRREINSRVPTGKVLLLKIKVHKQKTGQPKQASREYSED